MSGSEFVPLSLTPLLIGVFAAVITSASPNMLVRIPSVRAKPSSKVEIFSGRQNNVTNTRTPSRVSAILDSSGGR